MIPKTADYALRGAVCLAREPNVNKSADKLAKVAQIPRRYLHSVLQSLVRAGIVCSQPGPGGGYFLNKAPSQVTLLEVISAVGKLERIHRCPLGLPAHQELCPLHKELDRVYAPTESSFAKITLAKLAGSVDRPYPLCDVLAKRT